MFKSNKVLLLGAGGMLGTHISYVWNRDSSSNSELIVSTERFTRNDELLDYLSQMEPRAVINCIGCLSGNPEEQSRINGDFPRVMADWCEKNKSGLIHISTNAVFAPHPTRFWIPTDALNPITPYERSKALGEDPRAYVLRVSFIGKSPKKVGIYDRLCKDEPFTDRNWNGVTALDLAERILELAKRQIDAPASGVEHVYSAEPIRFTKIAELLKSRSRCQGDSNDARLLGGGIARKPLSEQLRDYAVFLKKFRI